MWWIIGSLIGAHLYKDDVPLVDRYAQKTHWTETVLAMILLLVALAGLGFLFVWSLGPGTTAWFFDSIESQK